MGREFRFWAAFGTTSKGLRSLLEKRIRLQLTENTGLIHRYEDGRSFRDSARFCQSTTTSQTGTFSISILESRGAQKLTDAVSQRRRLRLKLRGRTSRQRMKALGQ